MNKPTLTIGIPTYNHVKSLEKCLSLVTAQFADKKVFNRVEVFVSDNASQDDTKEVVKSFQNQFPNIRYARNERNLEFDRNVDAVLGNAKGVFCWTLSSNEYIKAGSIERVLSAIDNHPEVAFICVSNLREDVDKKEERYFNTGNQWLQEMGVFGGQISQCIFNMQYMIEDRSKYYDNAWIHLSVFLEMAAKRPVLLLPCLFQLPDIDPVCGWARNGGGGQAFRTHAFLKRIVAELPRYGYDQSVVDAVVRGLANGLPRNIASAKRYGLPVSWKNFILLVIEFKKYPLHLFMALIVFLTPSPLLRMVKKMK